MKPVCKPGDLAVIISAHNPENVGLIVEVLRRHVPAGGKLSMKRDEPVWDVRCSIDMVWYLTGKKPGTVRAKEGPAPDSCLWPIRPGPKESRKKLDAPAPAQGVLAL